MKIIRLIEKKDERHKLVRWYVSPLGSRHWVIKPVYVNLDRGEEFTTFVAHVSEKFGTKREAKAECKRRNSEVK